MPIEHTGLSEGDRWRVCGEGKMTQTKTVLAFDPSMQYCGWAILSLEENNEITFVVAGVYNLNTKRDIEQVNRLFAAAVSGQLLGITWEHNPFNAAHGRSDEEGQVIRRGQSAAVGILRGLAMAHGAKLLKPVNGLSAKKHYAGHGRATKEQIIGVTQTRFGETLGEHACDAISVGYTALLRYVEERDKPAKRLFVKKVKAKRKVKNGRVQSLPG